MTRADFGPWLGVAPDRWRLCAVEGCETPGKPHACPWDGEQHSHGCVHYDCLAAEADRARAAERLGGLVFRKGWGLLCDRHYGALTNNDPTACQVDRRTCFEALTRNDPGKRDLRVGARVRLRHDVSRFPHFVFRAGETGTITIVSCGNKSSHPQGWGAAIHVRMDRIEPRCASWDNEIVWDEEQVRYFLDEVEVTS